MSAIRIEQNRRIHKMREAGLTSAEIAARLGISLSHLYGVVSDPDGSKARKRRDKCRIDCPECGGTMSGGHGRARNPRMCLTCSRAAEGVSSEEIIASFQRFHEITGRSPAVNDTGQGRAPTIQARLSRTRLKEIDENPPLPSPGTVVRRFGSWRAALDAAGLSPAPQGRPGHREQTVEMVATLEVLRAGWITPEALAKRLGETRVRASRRLAYLHAKGQVIRKPARRTPGALGTAWTFSYRMR